MISDKQRKKKKSGQGLAAGNNSTISKKSLRTDAAALGKKNWKYCFTASLPFYHRITRTEKKGLQYLQCYTNTNVMLFKILFS